jgi:hypothetical protein
MTLHLYCPPNKQSKAYLVINNVRKGWPKTIDIQNYARTDGPALFWGFVGYNMDLIKDLQRRNKDFYFTDMAYFGRWMNNDTKHYWRIIKNECHPTVHFQRPSDRFDSFNIEVEPWKKDGKHILVCPSSPTMNNFYNEQNWIQDTVAKLQQHTDRKIIVRNKPRAKGTSGPRAVKLGGLKTFQEEVKDAWAIVTSVSMCAVESLCMGIPVFTTKYSPVHSLGEQDLSKIETPRYPDFRKTILNSLAYCQFTPQEFADGTARKIMEPYQ